MRPNWLLIAATVAAAFSWGIYVGYTGAWPWDVVRSVVSEKAVRFDTDAHWVAEPDKALTGQMDVVVLGDSLVALARWNELFPRVRIANRGISGDTVRGTASRLDTVLAVRPKLVIVMVGINDLLVNNDPATVVAAYDEMIAKLRVSTAVVVQAVPLCTGKGCQRARISAFNTAIREIADRRGAAFIDINRATSRQGAIEAKLASDGIHLSGAGYAAWRDALAPFMPSAPPTK